MVSKTEPLEWGMRKASIALPITILTPRSRYIHSLRSNKTSLTMNTNTFCLHIKLGVTLVAILQLVTSAALQKGQRIFSFENT